METGIPPEPKAPSRRLGVFDVLAFIVGAAAFAGVNALVYLISYRTFPNPGPQEDVRLEVLAIVSVVVLIALLGRPGRAFAAGFLAGLIAMTGAVGWCTAPWFDPGGTARRDAALVRRADAARAAAIVRAKEEWVEHVRHVGLDEATGIRRALAVLGCAEREVKSTGEYPAARDGLPASSRCQGFLPLQSDPTGWRMAYDAVVGADGKVSGFRLRLRPDAALGLEGPLVEVDERGLVTTRAREHAPAFVRASPMPALVGTVGACLRANVAAYSAGTPRPVTLTDLLFRPKARCEGDVPARPINADPDPNLSYNENAARLLIAAPGFGGDRSVAAYDLVYVPKGARPDEGYDLHARPTSYGTGGIRGYLLSSDGTTHVTTENRPATTADPLAEECEVDFAKPCRDRR